MRLFFVGQFIPYPLVEGSIIYVYHRVDRMRSKHDVVFFAPTRRPTDEESMSFLRNRGWTVETVSRPRVSKAQAVMARVRAFSGPIPVQWVLSWDDVIGQELTRQVSRHRPDAVIIEHLIASRFLPCIRKGTNAPIVFCGHNVEYLYEARLAGQAGLTFNGFLRRTQVRKVRACERAAYETARVGFAISDHDRELVQRLAPSATIYTLPAGVDMEYFTPDRSLEEEDRVVFTGVLDTLTNSEGAEWLVSEVLPLVRRERPNVRVDIVGRNPLPSVRALSGVPGVSVEANVPDIRPYVHRAAVVAAPIWPDSGVRLKLLEAFAMGKAVVSTAKAAEGLEVADGENILIREDPGSFAAAIVRLLNDESERHKLGEAGRGFAQRFSWDAICEGFDQRLREALEGRADAEKDTSVPHPERL